MMTIGGGARGVGERRAGEAFDEDGMGCEACTGVDPATSSEPPTEVEVVGEGNTVVYSVLVTTAGRSDADAVTIGARGGCVLGFGGLVELVAAIPLEVGKEACGTDELRTATELDDKTGGAAPDGAAPG